MQYKTRIQAKLKDNVTKVKVLIKHPMKTRGKDQDGKATPAHYITKFICEHNGVVVMSADWSAGVSANPYTAFQFEGGKVGDKVKVTWKDNRNNHGEAETEIK